MVVAANSISFNSGAISCKGVGKKQKNVLHLRLGVDLAQSEALNKCTSGSKQKIAKNNNVTDS